MIAREAPSLFDVLVQHAQRAPWDGVWRLSPEQVVAGARDHGALAPDGRVDYQRLAELGALQMRAAWRALWALTADGSLFLFRVAGDA